MGAPRHRFDRDGGALEVAQDAVVWQVVAAHGEDVVVEVETDLADFELRGDQRQRVVDRQDAPGLLTFLRIGDGPSRSEVAIAPEEREREVIGARRACRGLSMAMVSGTR